MSFELDLLISGKERKKTIRLGGSHGKVLVFIMLTAECGKCVRICWT